VPPLRTVRMVVPCQRSGEGGCIFCRANSMTHLGIRPWHCKLPFYHEGGHVRREMKVWLVLLGVSVLSALVAVHWWHKAFLPMTTERYAALCDNRPECYPEWGYLLGAFWAGVFAVCLALGLVITGVLWWFDSRLLGSAVEKPSDRA
jgi:hypothetical protein